MTARKYVNVRWVVAAALFPLVLLGLYALAMQIYSQVRFDPDYFAPEYREKYDTPGAVARTLEKALQSEDEALLAELQGRLRPASFTANPNIIFIMLWERSDRFFTYLYLDMQTYERQIYHFEKVRGRYVVTPPDAYYYLYSGRWVVGFVPVAIAWWLLEIVVVLAVWLYRLSARMREQMYGA